MAFGLVWFVIGAAFMVSLPWIVGTLPDPLARVFAFDADFLRRRAWPVVVLWLGGFAVSAAVLRQGRRSPVLRQLEMAFGAAWMALLLWWVAAGNMFQAPATNAGARAAVALVIVLIAAHLGYQLYRGRTRIRPLKSAG